MAKKKKKITMHPVEGTTLDKETELYPKTILDQIYKDESGETKAQIVQKGDNISILNNDAQYIKDSAVGKGTLTILVNNISAGTFNANESENKTISISIPDAANAVPKNLSIIEGRVTPKTSSEIQQSNMSIYVDNVDENGNHIPSTVKANELDYSKITVVNSGNNLQNIRNNDFIFEKKEA